jgi:hypothetical protein
MRSSNVKAYGIRGKKGWFQLGNTAFFYRICPPKRRFFPVEPNLLIMDFSHLDDSGSLRMVDVSGKPPMWRGLRAGLSCSRKPSNCFSARSCPRARCWRRLKSRPSRRPSRPRRSSRSTISSIFRGSTGVEMEAMTAVSVGTLTIYDV